MSAGGMRTSAMHGVMSWRDALAQPSAVWRVLSPAWPCVSGLACCEWKEWAQPVYFRSVWYCLDDGPTHPNIHEPSRLEQKSQCFRAVGHVKSPLRLGRRCCAAKSPWCWCLGESAVWGSCPLHREDLWSIRGSRSFGLVFPAGPLVVLPLRFDCVLPSGLATRQNTSHSCVIRLEDKLGINLCVPAALPRRA